MEIKYLNYCNEAKDFVVKSTENNLLYKHLYDLKEKHWGLNVAIFIDLGDAGLHQAIKDPNKDCYYLYYHTCGFFITPKHREGKLTKLEFPSYLDNLLKETPIDEPKPSGWYGRSGADLFKDTAGNFHYFCETLKKHRINHLFLQELYGK
jgi:hypothetical protein